MRCLLYNESMLESAAQAKTGKREIIMDNEKIGKLIYGLRKERNMTQLQLAEILHISDKTVSKWERGQGCPDISLLVDLSCVLGVDMEKLLSGRLEANEERGGNMKKLNFYVCPECGNVITAMTEAGISCCGKKPQPLEAVKAPDEERLLVENIENDYYISSDHPMLKEHYISFVALLTGDMLTLKKQYPEWDLQVRIPGRTHGKLIWYCTEHGLFYQLV